VVPRASIASLPFGRKRVACTLRRPAPGHYTYASVCSDPRIQVCTRGLARLMPPRNGANPIVVQGKVQLRRAKRGIRCEAFGA
jgi:hypothetical protein